MVRRFLTSFIAVTSVVTLTACSTTGTTGNGADPGAAQETTAAPEVSVDGTAAAGEKLTLTVSNGTFESVTLKNDDNTGVGKDTGELAGEGATASAMATEEAEPTIESTTPGLQGGAGADAVWQSNYQLAGDESYTWEAEIVDADGNTHTETGTVETKKATGDDSRVSTVIGDDQTVGVGAPIILMFSGIVQEEYRGAVENRLSVTTEDENGKKIEVEGSWAWLYDTDGHSRIHYRTKEFWPANTKVTVSAPLEGVMLSESTQGAKDLKLSFDVGREQVVVADAKKHTMVVKRNGKVVSEYPASLGAPKSPSYNGTHIVMSKATEYTMSSERWNYETDVQYAVRIHNNGEFIHAAPWSVGSQGRANVSHGCVNLSTANAAEYFTTAIYGDPVEITGSSVSLSTESSDISDWVYDWDDWKALSALAENR